MARVGYITEHKYSINRTGRVCQSACRVHEHVQKTGYLRRVTPFFGTAQSRFGGYLGILDAETLHSGYFRRGLF